MGSGDGTKKIDALRQAFDEVNHLFRSTDIKPSYALSFLHLGVDLMLNAAFFALSFYLVNNGLVNTMLYWPVYSYAQGALATGLWVMGHECGHGGFSPSKTVNDVVGYILHTALLVPYFSWQYTHGKHHKYTNHLTLGETHVPHTKKEWKELGLELIDEYLGEDAYAILMCIGSLVVGWPMYIFANVTGGRVKADGKTPLDKGNFYKELPTQLTMNHLMPNEIFPARWHTKVCLSTAGLVGFVGSMLYYFGPRTLAYWYGGPYMVVNGWLVMYTYLQHTSPNIPHYNTKEYTFFMGATSTIDRPYNALTNYLHHHIGDSHVVHHINSRIPFYKAKELTPKVAEILRKHGLYNYDSRPALLAFFDTEKKCKYVEGVDGVQYFNKAGVQSFDNAVTDKLIGA